MPRVGRHPTSPAPAGTAQFPRATQTRRSRPRAWDAGWHRRQPLGGSARGGRMSRMGSLRRGENLERVRAREPWDVLIIGGGATGLGTAVDAAARGYRTLLLEAHDFAQGTSSRSTKLIHGGVRYLAQGNYALVREALHERAILLRNA